MLGVIKTSTGSYDLGYFALAACLVGAGCIMLTLKKEVYVDDPEEGMVLEEHAQA